MTTYDREWTILGLVDVQDDMHMWPGHRIRLIEGPSGVFRIVVLKGDRFWEMFKNLREVSGGNPVIPGLPVPDSVTLADEGPYAQAVRTFKDNSLFSVRRLHEKLTVGPDVHEVDIAVPTTNDGTNREILVVRIEHKSAGPAQNGTGHGDWT